MKLCLNNNDVDVIENDGSGPKVWEHGLYDTEFQNNIFILVVHTLRKFAALNLFEVYRCVS